MAIYTGQRIPIETTFTRESDGSIIDISGATIRYDYWFPGNSSSTPDGFVSGIVVDGVAGEASSSIPDSINSIKGSWKIQGVAIISGEEWPECTTKFKVLARGKICS